MKRWECWVIGVAVIVVAFLFALNGRYYVIPNGGYVIDKWTRTMYTTKGTFKYPDQPIYKQQEVSVVPEGGRKLTLDEAYEKVVNGNDPSGQKRPTIDEAVKMYYEENSKEAFANGIISLINEYKTKYRPTLDEIEAYYEDGKNKNKK